MFTLLVGMTKQYLGSAAECNTARMCTRVLHLVVLNTPKNVLGALSQGDHSDNCAL